MSLFVVWLAMSCLMMISKHSSGASVLSEIRKCEALKVCCLLYNWPLSLIIFSVNHILGNFASPRLQSHTQKKNRTNLPTMMRKPSLVLYWLVWFGRTTWSSRAPAALASTVRMLSSVCRKRWRHLHRKQIEVKNCIRKIP